MANAKTSKKTTAKKQEETCLFKKYCDWKNIFIFITISFGVILVIDIWTEFLSESFDKVLLTYLIIIATLFIVRYIKHDIEEDERMKKDKYMN